MEPGREQPPEGELPLYATGLRCIVCETLYPLDTIESCARCRRPDEEHALNETLVVDYDLEAVARVLDRDELGTRPAGLWRTWELMPVRDPSLRTEAGVGGTPLVSLRSFSGADCPARVWAKLESANPTGSFKDRPVSVAVARAIEEGADEFCVFTSGNVGAALAAACARVGRAAHVFLLSGAGTADSAAPLSQSKLGQIAAYGAELLTTKGSLAELYALAEHLQSELGWTSVNRYLALHAEGDKTIAFELCSQLGWQVPDAVVVPVGTGTNLFGIHNGFEQFRALGFIDRVPRMIAVQPAGADSLAAAFRTGADVVDALQTVRINVAPPLTHRVSGQHAYQAIRSSGGAAVSVTDEEILAARHDLARREGVLVEAASAAALAGVRRALTDGVLARSDRVVAILTSSGLKDLVGGTGPAQPDPLVLPSRWPEFLASYRG